MWRRLSSLIFSPQARAEVDKLLHEKVAAEF